MDPVIAELLKQCDTVEDFAVQIDALAAQAPEPEPARPKYKF